MREIKFRLYDKQEKKMIFTGFHVFGEVTLFSAIDQYCHETKGDRNGLERYNDFELMQFTGLQDKNGKDIYKGDLLRFEGDEINFTAFEVFFHDGDAHSDYNIGWSINRTHHQGNICGGFIPSFKPKTTKRMIIIGNIHENPELLN